LVLLDQRPQPPRVLSQKTESATAPLGTTRPSEVVQALLAALDDVLWRIERDVAADIAARPRARTP
jgi:hypothetical protein